jgi:hypothetical protein
MPDATFAIIAAAAIFVVGCALFYLSDTWNDMEDE